MTNTNLLKETAQFGLKKEYGFAPSLDEIEIVNDTAFSFTFKVGNHEYAYNYNSDLDSPITKKDGNEKSLRDQAKTYFDKWLKAIA